MPIVSAIENTFQGHSLVKKVLENVYEDILLFHRRAVRFFKQKGQPTISLSQRLHKFKAGLIHSADLRTMWKRLYFYPRHPDIILPVWCSVKQSNLHPIS